MGRDKYHLYQTVGDAVWLFLTDRKDSPPVNQKLKVDKRKDEQKPEEQLEDEQTKKVKDGG
jgi:hypothetical protein